MMILLLSAPVLFAGEKWIQVIYDKDADAVTPEFLERVKGSGYPYRRIQEKGSLKIWMGSFDSYQKAEDALALIRCRITPDAFIVHEDEGPVAVGVYTPMKPVVKKEILKAVKKVEVDKVAQTEEKVVEKEKKCDCISGKKAIRTAQIESAVEFYRRSPYHRFTGVEESLVN